MLNAWADATMVVPGYACANAATEPDQVVGRALAQCSGDLGDPLVGKMGIDAVHDGDLVVADQVRVVGHAVGHVVLALKQVNKVVVDADIQNIFGDSHTCKPPEKYQSCYSGHSIA